MSHIILTLKNFFPLDIIKLICLLMNRIKLSIKFVYGKKLSSFIINNRLFLWDCKTNKITFLMDKVKTACSNADEIFIVTKSGEILRYCYDVLYKTEIERLPYINDILVIDQELLTASTDDYEIIVINLNKPWKKERISLTHRSSRIESTHIAIRLKHSGIYIRDDGLFGDYISELYLRNNCVNDICLHSGISKWISSEIVISDITLHESIKLQNFSDYVYFLVKLNNKLVLRDKCYGSNILIKNICLVSCVEDYIYFLTKEGDVYKCKKDETMINKLSVYKVKEMHGYEYKIFITQYSKIYVNKFDDLQVTELKIL